MTRDEMMALAHRMHDAANAGDYAATQEIFAPDFHSHPLGTTGVSAIRDAWRAIRARYPRLHTEIRDVLVDGDRVALRAEITGAARPAATLMEVFRVRHGHIAELWGLTSLPL